MNSKIFNIICVICTIIFITISLFLLDMTKDLQIGQVFFRVEEFSNTNYVNEDKKDMFYTDGKTLTLKLNNETLYDNVKFKLDKKTGELVIDELNNPYVTSVDKDFITIWYKKAEYKINREIILK